MKLLDLFSGIGGFHKGFEQAGFEFDWVGFSEIHKYASAVYKHRFPNAKELGDVNIIQPERLPDHIDFLCGGFPCQAFSMAGKRKGFDDTRGTLFFEIARILKYFREHRTPIDYFVLENVKGLLSHDNGRTFSTIYRVLTDIGYTVEFQLLNTRWFLPQNRERIYLVGYIGSGRGSKVFPIGETSQSASEISLKQIGTIGEDSEVTRVYDANGLSKTIKDGGGMGVKTGLYEIKEATYNYGSKSLNKTLEKENLGKDDIKALDLYNHKAQDIAPTLTLSSHGTLRLYEKSNIRRFTPIECERLQGFPDGWTSEGVMNGKVVPMSDTQRYKQCGNAVTVNVVQAVAEKLNKIRGLK